MLNTILSLIILFDSIAIVVVLCAAYPDWRMAILTFLAVLVALFRDRICAFYLPPALVLSASSESNHFYEVVAVNKKTGLCEDYQAWFSIIVENKGLSIAKNVELIFNGLDSNIVKNIDAYCGLPLKRAWIHSSSVFAFHRNVKIPYGICYISKKNPSVLHFQFSATPTELVSIPCSSDRVNKFKFEVIALSDNAAEARIIVEIIYDCTYMDGFKIK